MKKCQPISKLIKIVGNTLVVRLVDIVVSCEGRAELEANRRANNSPKVTIRLLSENEMNKG